MTNVDSALKAALQMPQPALGLRDVVKKSLDGGADRGAIAGDLQSLRAQVSDEEEDVILEVLDFLEGWSRPGLGL